MTGRILLNRIAIYGYHGVFAEEQGLGQRFYVSANVSLSFDCAAKTDQVADTVHYGELAQLLHTIGTQERFNLIEALAARMADASLDHFPTIKAVTIRIEKPNAPIPLPMDGVAVEITRLRGGDQ